MHQSLSTTDGEYGILSNRDVQRQISGLGQKSSLAQEAELSELVAVTRQLLEQVEEKIKKS